MPRTARLIADQTPKQPPNARRTATKGREARRSAAPRYFPSPPSSIGAPSIGAPSIGGPVATTPEAPVARPTRRPAGPAVPHAATGPLAAQHPASLHQLRRAAGRARASTTPARYGRALLVGHGERPEHRRRARRAFEHVARQHRPPALEVAEQPPQAGRPHPLAALGAAVLLDEFGQSGAAAIGRLPHRSGRPRRTRRAKVPEADAPAPRDGDPPGPSDDVTGARRLVQRHESHHQRMRSASLRRIGSGASRRPPCGPARASRRSRRAGRDGRRRR